MTGSEAARRDREQDDRLQRVRRADDDVQTAQPGGRRGVELGWRRVGHVPQGTAAGEKRTPRAPGPGMGFLRSRAAVAVSDPAPRTV